MYQMKCMNPLHASLTNNLSDPNQNSKMFVVIQIQTVRHTDGIGWYFKSILTPVLKKLIHQKKIREFFLFSVGGIRLAPVKTEKSKFSIQALQTFECDKRRLRQACATSF